MEFMRKEIIFSSLVYVMCLMEGLALAYRLLSDHCKCVRRHKVENTPSVRATEEKERDDEQFLRRRISFLTEEEMIDLEPGLLGSYWVWVSTAPSGEYFTRVKRLSSRNSRTSVHSFHCLGKLAS